MMKVRKILAVVTVIFLLGGIFVNTSFFTRKKSEVYSLLKEKYDVTEKQTEEQKEMKTEKIEEKQEVVQQKVAEQVSIPKEETAKDSRTTENIIWDYLTNNGFTDIQAAAIIGNMYQESGLNPARIESNGIGAGLVQWSYGRRTQLEEYAKSKNTEWTDINAQLEFFLKEWQTGKQIWGENKLKFNNPYSVDEATEAFCWGFERPRVQDANLKNRIAKAWEAYYRNEGR